MTENELLDPTPPAGENKPSEKGKSEEGEKELKESGDQGDKNKHDTGKPKPAQGDLKGGQVDPNKDPTRDETKQDTKDANNPSSNETRYYGKVGVGVGNASNSTFNSYFGSQRPEEEKSLFELVIPLPPRKSDMLEIAPEELGQKIGELREKRLILISCADEALAYAAAYAAFDKLGADERQKYMLKFDSKGTETASLSINLFCEESKNSKAETIFLLDASSDSAKPFIDSLLPFGNLLWFDDVLSRNSYLIICIVNLENIKNSLKRLKFPHWNLDFLHCLLKHHFPNHAGLEERILSQRERGKWSNNENYFCEEIKTLIRNNQLLEVIQAHEECTESTSEECTESTSDDSLFEGIDPIREAVLYVATFFDNLSPAEFKQVVTSLLGDRTMTIISTAQKQTGNGATETSEVEKEVSLCKKWQENPDKILKECRLVAISNNDSIKTIKFSDLGMRDRVKEYFELERSFFLEEQFENVQSQGLLFHQAAKVNESTVRMIVERTASYPGYFDGDLLVGIIRELEQTPQSAGGLETPGFQFIRRIQSNRKAWVYTRIAELLRKMLEHLHLKDTVEGFLQRLMSVKFHGAVLNIVKRLQFAPEFDLLRWVKQLLDQGSDDTSLNAYLFLYGYVRKMGPTVYDTLKVIEEWLPSSDRDPAFYSKSNKFALRLLMENCWNTALSFNPKYYGSQPCRYPLFAIKDMDAARDAFKLLSRWLLHEGMAAILDTDAAGEESGEEEDPNLLISIIIAQWVFILVGPNEEAVASGNSTAATLNIRKEDFRVEDNSKAVIDNSLLLSLLLRELAEAIEKPQQEKIQLYWEGLVQFMNVSIDELPYRGNHREMAIRRRNLVRDMARQFKSLVREEKSLKRQKVNA